MTGKVRVLIIDDSALVRKVLTDALSRDPDIEVVGTANDPYAARDKINTLAPDVLTLDIEMPRMDGLSFLRILMQQRPMPVVMVSTLTSQGADVTLEALAIGAVDVVEKPTLDVLRGMDGRLPELLAKVKAAARARPGRGRSPRASAGSPETRSVPSAETVAASVLQGRASAVSAALASSTVPPRGVPATDSAPAVITTKPSAPKLPSSPTPSRAASLPAKGSLPGRSLRPRRDAIQLFAVGASTGGTEALRVLLDELPPDSPPVVIVQHMPPAFTAAFARRCDQTSPLRVVEATHGTVLEPGFAYIAPGGLHTRVAREGHELVTLLDDGERINLHRPSVDALFASVAKLLGARAVGALLTGMGNDGARGLLQMREAGAHTIAQDKDSCVVYGMPREAVAMNAVCEVLPLDEIAAAAAKLFAR